MPHGSYKRTLIDIEHGKVSYGSVEIKRVRCKSCGHTHAILPDYIVPYTTYSLLFILRVLAAHFWGTETVGQLCQRYSKHHDLKGAKAPNMRDRKAFAEDAFGKLRQAGQQEWAEEMWRRVLDSGSEFKALAIMGEYVEFEKAYPSAAAPPHCLFRQ